MANPERAVIVGMWNTAWNEGLWAASWNASLAGLSAEQAAWKPAIGGAGRHSIWQIVLHMIFWRENWLGRLDGGPRPTEAEQAAFNFPIVTDRSQGAWEATLARFARTQRDVGAALAERGAEADGMMHFLPHDCYHFGQISYLRAMQGFPPIE